MKISESPSTFIFNSRTFLTKSDLLSSFIQACDVSSFCWNSGFLTFFFAKNSISEIHLKIRRKSGVGLIIYIVLLNRGIPDVKTIVYQSKKKRKTCLQKLAGVSVSKKAGVVCSANDVYCLMFTHILYRKLDWKAEKKQTEKKLTIHQTTT